MWNLGGWIAVQRMARLGIRSVAPSVERAANQIRTQLDVAKTVQVVESFLVQVPCVIGWLRPIILLPAGLCTGLTPAQLEMVLAHELAHVRRLDYLANLLQTVVETLFFFHPAVHYVSGQMRAEREYCADQLALSVTGDSIAYSKLLSELSEQVASEPRYAMAASGGSLTNRVKRLFGLACQDGGRTGSWVLGALASVVILAVVIAVPSVRAAVSDPAPRVLLRRVWADSTTDLSGRVSPDGRYIAYINWENGNLGVHDLKTNENRELTTGGGWEPPHTWAEYPLWSPDSRRIAYAWYVGSKQDLRVVTLDGAQPRVIVEAESEVEFAYPLDWSPDGRRILASVQAPSGSDLAFVGVADGSLQCLPQPTPPSEVASVSPDGKYIAYDTRRTADDRDIFLLDIESGSTSALVQHPADDHQPMWSPNGKWLTFISTRSGETVPWMVPFVNGKATREPRHVAPSLTGAWPMGITSRGVITVGFNSRQNDVYQVAYDPDNNSPNGLPALLVQRFEGRNWMPCWSPDGKKLAVISSRPAPGGGSKPTVVVRDEATGKEYYPPLEFKISPIRGHLEWLSDNQTLLIHAIARKAEHPRRQQLFAWNVDRGVLTPLADRPAEDFPKTSFTFCVSPDDASIYYVKIDKNNTARVVPPASE